MRDHAVCDDAAVFCDGNIRCSGSDIHKRDIQHSKVLRDRYIDRRDRLECQIDYFKSREIHCGIKTVHDILREEGHNDIFRDRIRLMSLKIRKHLIIQVIMHNRVADTVKFVLRIILLREHLLCLLDSEQIQGMNVLSGDDRLLRELVLYRGRHGF